MEVLLGFAGLPSTTSSFKIILLLLLDFPQTHSPIVLLRNLNLQFAAEERGKLKAAAVPGFPQLGKTPCAMHIHYWRHPVRPTILETSCDTHIVRDILRRMLSETPYDIYNMWGTLRDQHCGTDLM